jgi:hypothetical protein
LAQASYAKCALIKLRADTVKVGKMTGAKMGLSAPPLALCAAVLICFVSSYAWVIPAGMPPRSSLPVSSNGELPQPGFGSSTTALPPLATCGAVACLAAAAFLASTRKQSVVARQSAIYNNQGVFPGGGDGSWREGKKGSFGKDSPTQIAPVPYPSGNTPMERMMQYGENFTSSKGVKGAGAAKSAASTPIVALGVAALIVFWAAQASNAMPN